MRSYEIKAGNWWSSRRRRPLAPPRRCPPASGTRTAEAPSRTAPGIGSPRSRSSRPSAESRKRPTVQISLIVEQAGVHFEGYAIELVWLRLRIAVDPMRLHQDDCAALLEHDAVVLGPI